MARRDLFGIQPFGAALVVVVGLVAALLIGCDHAKEMIEQGKKDAAQLQKKMSGDETKETTTAPPAATTEPAAPAATPLPTTPPPPPNAEQVIAEFKKIEPMDRTEDNLRQLAAIPEEARAQITELDMSRGLKLRDGGMAEIAKFPNLMLLKINHCLITDAGLKHLAKTPQIEELYLDDNAVTNDGLAAIAALKKLRILSLARTRITDDGLVHLNNMPQLEWLNIRETSIQGFGFKPMKPHGHLKFLDVSKTQFGKEGLVGIHHLHSLEEFRAHDCQLHDRILVGLAGNKNLRYLDVSANMLLTDDGIRQFANGASLETVIMDYTQASDRCLPFFRSAKNLALIQATHTTVSQPAAQKILPKVDVKTGS